MNLASQKNQALPCVLPSIMGNNPAIPCMNLLCGFLRLKHCHAGYANYKVLKIEPSSFSLSVCPLLCIIHGTMRRQLTPEELDTLYWSVGRCIWHIQYLEDVLHTYLTLKVEIREPGRVTEEEAHELLAKHRRANLGTALNTASKHAALPPELLATLRGLKEERDWLVHRSMHQDGDSLYTDEGRNLIFTKLDTIMEKTLALKGQVEAETIAFCTSQGVSSQQAEKLAHEKITRLRGGTP